MSSQGGSQMHVVEQALDNLRKTAQYINTGMEITEELAVQNAVTEEDDSSDHLKELRQTMLDYAGMEGELKQYLECVDYVKKRVASESDDVDLNAVLNSRLKETKHKRPDPKTHKKFTDMEEKIKVLTEGEASQGSSGETQLADDLMITQSSVNTRCPYTGHEMKDPVKNKLCGHSYDREGILHCIKSRKGKAKCPVGGCPNTKPVTEAHLEPNKELKNFIIRKAKQSRGQT